ncbi:MAG TPA: hypothetical protein VKG62_00160 [Solirubrobacteraceae bacterium]|nr:hypothetical protein [Solirubrobacteraceae bacterium]
MAEQSSGESAGSGEGPTAGPPSRELVLAAVERAERHRTGEDRGVPRRTIVEHLSLRARSAESRRVLSLLRELQAEGLLEPSRRHGVEVWTSTAAGEEALASARAGGRAPLLGESPQHLAWREARMAAGQELGRFRRRLRRLVDEADRLLRADPPPDSDAWLELAEALREAARTVGSAEHCLREWKEPDDRRADVDTRREEADGALAPRLQARRRRLRAGRRNIRLWERPPV